MTEIRDSRRPVVVPPQQTVTQLRQSPADTRTDTSPDKRIQAKRMEDAMVMVPAMSCAAQHTGAMPKIDAQWVQPPTRLRETYQAAPSASKTSADPRDVHDIQAQFKKLFTPNAAICAPGLCFTPADRPAVSTTEANKVLQNTADLFSKAQKNGSLDDLVQKMKANGSLGQLADATKLDSGLNEQLSETLAKGLSASNLRQVFSEFEKLDFEKRASPMVTLDGQGKSPLSTAIGQHSSDKVKSDFVGEMAYNYKSTQGQELAGPDSKAARVATANALAGLPAGDGKKPWGYLNSQQLNAIGDTATQRASSLGAKVYGHLPLTTPYGDPSLATGLVKSAMAADPQAKAVAFEAASDVLSALSDADKQQLLHGMTGLLKTDVKGITRELRDRPDSGRAATQYTKAMIEPALGGFSRRGKDLVQDENIQTLGSIVEQLADDPKNPGSMEDYLNARTCVVKGDKEKTADVEFGNAKDLFHWLGATKRAANELATQWKMTSTGHAIQGAGFTSFSKDVASNLVKGAGKKMAIGTGAAGIAVTIAFEARDYYRNISADTKTAASWLRNLTDPDSAMSPYAQLQARQSFNDVLNNHWD
jgi:hypothetical protein